MSLLANFRAMDGIFIGPADLVASMGHLGHPGHPDARQAIDAAIARVLTAGKAPGILAVDGALARHYIALGARFVAVGVDVIKTADWLIEMGPEGGAGGGQVVEAGSPEDVAACEGSHTGRLLRAMFRT